MTQDEFWQILQNLKSRKRDLSVEGHTDSQPVNTARFPNNWVLSSMRAVAVVDALTVEGVSASRLVAAGFGEHRPVADNASEDGRRKNRRVVVAFSK